jgi:rubrerythrin
MNTFARAIALVMAVLMVTILPLRYMAINQIAVSDSLIDKETKEFADDIMTQGLLTLDMYVSFVDKISVTAQMYDIDLIHSRSKDSHDEVAHNQFEENETYIGKKKERVKQPSFTRVNTKSQNKGISLNSIKNTATKQISSASLEEYTITSFATHTHNDNCYSGHRHTSSSNNFFIHNHKHSNCVEYTKASYVMVTCTSCNKVYNASAAYWHWYNGPVFDGNYNTYKCPNCGGTGTKDSKYYYDYGYSCGYDKDLNGDGFGDKVGYTTAYNYNSTIPQTTDWGIYTSGCYGYHQAKYISDYYIYYEGSYTISASSVRTALSQLTSKNFTGFCKIPKYIAIGLSERDFQSSPYYNPQEWPNITSVRYETFIDTNGSIKFRFNSYWETGSWGGNTYYNNPGFPAILTIDQFKSYSYSSPINSLFKTATGKDYNYSRNGNIEAHIQYFVGTNRVDSTEYLNVCTFNHSLGLNKWIQTCGQTQDDTIDCDKVVTSIIATRPNQTVDKGENIITTATATYLDGHTGTVNCTSNFNTNRVGIQTVTLTYSGLVNNARTNGTLTCTLSATVKENAIPTALTVIPSSYTVYNGSEPTYTVEVTYQNGSKKVVTTGYTKTGFTSGAGSKEVVFTYTENSKTVSATVIILVKRNLKTCVNGHEYELDDFDTDLGCPVCSESIDSIIVSPDTLTVRKGLNLNITVTARYQDYHTAVILSGWTSDFDNKQIGEQIVTIEYMGKTAILRVTVEDKADCPICGLTYEIDELNPGCPVCSKNIVSITATPNTQTIGEGADLIIEVEALFQDGHKEIVGDWISDFNPFKIGTQKVNITYKTASTTVTVTISSTTDITCPICGTTYNFATNPNGCPVCSIKIDHIEARLRSEGTKVQLGSELNLYIIVVFKDGHKEQVNSDWKVEGFQAEVLGVQTLTVKYKGFATNITIEVINGLEKVTCPNGHVYYLNEDGSDPGCPYCNIDEISGTSTNYIECIYTNEIINILYEEGIYTLKKGDYFTVEVHKKTASVYDRLRNIWKTEHAEFKQFTYGGRINN